MYEASMNEAHSAATHPSQRSSGEEGNFSTRDKEITGASCFEVIEFAQHETDSRVK